MPRTSKDLARRLRYQRRPARLRFWRWYLPLGLLAVAAGFGLWRLLDTTLGAEQYAPGPVAAGHRTFGDACAKCHVPFQQVRDDACLECHPPARHSPYEIEARPCASCHVEHRGRLLAVENASCIACHADLRTTRPAPEVQPMLASFADHPTFRPLREGTRDEAALRFNHRMHLTSTRIPEQDRLACASCHVLDPAGALMAPVVFEEHCERCHTQALQGPLGAIAVPHAAPALVREQLRAQLVDLAIADPVALFGERPGRLPGRSTRGPVDQARSLQEYRRDWLERLESELYRPFETPTPGSATFPANERCFLCHLEGRKVRAAGEAALAAIVPTNVPARWLSGAAFAHRPHRLVECERCHAGSATSPDTSDVNLPSRAVCHDCHVDGAPRSAGAGCVLCHRYHPGRV